MGLLGILKLPPATDSFTISTYSYKEAYVKELGEGLTDSPMNKEL